MKTMSKLQEILEENWRTSGKVRSYSGHAMYGRTCVAVKASIGQVMVALIQGTGALRQDEADELATDVSCVRTDSMGTGTIVYFPDVEHVGLPGGDEEEDEEDDGSIAYAARVNEIR